MEWSALAAGAAALLYGIIALFQLALALGAPWGEASWGGQHAGVLPARLRMGSALSALVWLSLGLVVLQVGGLIDPFLGERAARIVLWSATVLIGLSTAANAASRSTLEKIIWTPVAALAFLLTLALLLLT
jgi:hypothetical protein